MKKILLSISVLFVFIVTGCAQKEEVKPEDVTPESTSFSFENSINTGYSQIIVNSINEVNRSVPKILSGSVSEYPGNGVIVTDSVQKSLILNENIEMFNFDYLDENGFYYKDSIKLGTQLYKHSAADNQVASYLSQDEVAVSANLTLRKEAYDVTDPSTTLKGIISADVTGLYAPAGEIIKVELSQELIDAGAMVYIGATSSRGETSDITETNNYSRFPMRTYSTTLTSTTTYLGSPLGGQIYVSIIDKNITQYDVKISNAVQYTHYILGTTTDEEFYDLYDSSAPMMDIIVPGIIRMNMPRSELTALEDNHYNALTTGLNDLSDTQISNYRKQAKDLTIKEFYEAVDQWQKFGSISNYIARGSTLRTVGVTTFYDSYIPAGAAVAIPGKNYSCNPITWGRNSIDPDASDWGGWHEFNHHHYNSAAFIETASNNEVSNNVQNVLGYVMYTDYNGYRTSEGGLYDGWTDHAFATFPIGLLKKNSADNAYSEQLAKYTTLIHSFGPEKFIDVLMTSTTASDPVSRFFKQCVLGFEFDMTYYFQDLLGYTISDEVLEWTASQNLPTYIPMATDLQMGQIVNEETHYTMQTFGILEEQTININERFVVPTGMSVEVISVSSPVLGNVSKVNGNHLYTSNGEEEIDTFEVVAKVYNGEYESTQTFICGIAPQKPIAQTTTAKTYRYYNYNNMTHENLNVDELTLQGNHNSSSSSINYSLANGVLITEATIIFPETKTYDLYFKGRGDIQINMSKNSFDYKKEISFKSMDSNNGYDQSDSTRKYSINAKAGDRICLEIIVITSTRCEFEIGYMDNNTITAIPADWFYGANSSVGEMNSSYYSPIYKESIYSYRSEVNYSDNVTPVEGISIIQNDSSLPLSDNVFYGIKGSSPSISNVGEEIIVDYGILITANMYNLQSYSSQGGVTKGIEMYVSVDGITYVEAFNGENNYSDNSYIKFNTTHTYQYLKFKVTSIHNNDYRYRMFTFIPLHESLNSLVYDATSEFIVYESQPELITDINSFNKNTVEFSGELTFNFSGTDFAIYSNMDSKYQSFELQIDNGEWITININSDTYLANQRVFNITGLTQTSHSIKIRSSNLSNIDYFTFK